VAGRGHCVGVVVVAIRKVGAALEEEIEAGGSLEVVAVAVQIVAAELVDDEDDDEFGGRVVGVCTGGRGGGDGKQGDERGGAYPTGYMGNVSGRKDLRQKIECRKCWI
jgi:hypothetical protein